MERTLDSIRPSDIDEIHGNVSYLYPRDPSIQGFGQRRLPAGKQNLISLYEDEDQEYSEECSSLASDSVPLQTIKVYLRVKPLPRNLKLTREEIDAYQIVNCTTLLTKLPSLDHNASSLKGSKTNDRVCRKFTFTQTFGPETTQLQLFEEVIQQKMVNFLTGQNSTVMTYGTTNAGKSYTLQGTSTSPGIIPRSLEFVFSNVNTRPTPSYKPYHNSRVVSLTGVERAQELEAKNKLLTFASIEKHQYIHSYREMQKLLQEESPIRPSQACDAQYSVWVSFAEIYNENIYDLLSNECQKRRPVLKLGADSHGRAFIRGLKTICVNSGSEAYQVMMAGQYNLKVAATALNARSSRSHCIFTIHLLKYYVENNPDGVKMSTFSFCDLAGSERLKKTLNVGDRLKEAQNINTSLLVLGRCLKSIYESQAIRNRHEHVGPFRESKLTRLFQTALSGKEEIALIVSVNPIPNLYIETQNVLNFSAIAKKIVIESKKIKRRMSHTRFSQIVANSVKSSTDWTETELSTLDDCSNADPTEESSFIHREEYDDLQEENKNLKKEIGALKASMLNRDLQIRQELADTYSAMMKKVESDWKNRVKDVEEQQEDHLEWTVNRVETFYKDKLNELTSRKRQRVNEDDDVSDEDGPNYSELEIENTRLTTKVHSLKKTIKILRESNEIVTTEKNKLAFELGLAQDELKSANSLLKSAQKDLYSDENEDAYVDGLRNELQSKQEHITKLKQFLNEAKEEYITITDDAARMEAHIKEQDEAIAEYQERVNDLEDILEQVNVCLAEKTKSTETLEENLNSKSNLLIEAQSKIENYEKMIHELTKKAAEMEKLPPCTEKVHIKQEFTSEFDEDASTEISQSPITEGIIIKTDIENNTEIPISCGRFTNDIFVEISEIPVNETEAKANSTMLPDSETEIKILKNKLAQSIAEIQLLKESLNSAKLQLNDMVNKFEETRKFQENEISMRGLESLALDVTPLVVKTTRDQGSSPVQKEVENFITNVEKSASQTTATSNTNQSNQTSFTSPKCEEKSVQTAVIVDNMLIETEKSLKELNIQYDNLKKELKKKESLVEQMEQEIQKLRQIDNQKTLDDNAKFEEFARNRELLETDLATAIAEKEAVEKTLEETNLLVQKLECQLKECRVEHELKIKNLEVELIQAKEREETQSKAHTEKMLNFEDEWSMKWNTAENEKRILEQRLKKNIAEIESLRERVEESDKKEQEKEEEIRQLQKAIKTTLSSNIHDKKTEKELKKTLKELLDTKEVLTRKEEMFYQLNITSKAKIRDLELQLTGYESNSKALEILQKNAQDAKNELEKLRIENTELKCSICENEREMESFKKNRDETIVKYENWVKAQQEELERGKREITRFQELFHRMQTTPKQKVVTNEEEHQKLPIPVVDLCGSEKKRATRRTPLPHSVECPPSETKRSTRTKRLYQPSDDSRIDVDPADFPPPTPSPKSTRSLRTRRK